MSRFAWRLPSQRLRPRRAPAREHMAGVMAGLPGSGKTRVIDGRYGLSRSTTLLLDLDTEIIHHPKYDPDDPPAVYASAGAYRWADERVEEKFQAALPEAPISPARDGRHRAKVERRVRRMDDAKRAGWFAKLLHVDVSLETALRATRNATACREDVLAQYARLIADAVAFEAAPATEVEVFDNNADDGLVGRQPGATSTRGCSRASRRFCARPAARRRRRLDDGAARTACGRSTSCRGAVAQASQAIAQLE